MTSCGSCENRRFGDGVVSIIKVKRIGKLGSTLAVSSNSVPEATRTSETSVLTRATRRHIPENGAFHTRRHENLNSYNYKLVQKMFHLRNAKYISEEKTTPTTPN
jgi:hypothetical protein